MDFDEFSVSFTYKYGYGRFLSRVVQDIAVSQLSTEPQTRSVVCRLLNLIKSKKLDEGWYIKPGTVLRCDMEHEEELGVSAIFVSVPNSHPGSSAKFSTTKFEQRLCEAFCPFVASPDQDKNQQFRKHEGAKLDQVLWVRQTWILVSRSGKPSVEPDLDAVLR
jgi:hypothetical protein